MTQPLVRHVFVAEFCEPVDLAPRALAPQCVDQPPHFGLVGKDAQFSLELRSVDSPCTAAFLSYLIIRALAYVSSDSRRRWLLNLSSRAWQCTLYGDDPEL